MENHNPELPKQIFVAFLIPARASSVLTGPGDELVTLQEKRANVLADYLVSDLST